MPSQTCPAPKNAQEKSLRDAWDPKLEVSKARTRLLTHVPFFGYLSMQLRPIECPDDVCPTAGIAPDGTLVLNKRFCSALTLGQFAGLLAHEICHAAFFYWARRGPRNHTLFNCFPAGTYVGGAEKPIESVGVGETVLTASGRAPTNEFMAAPSGADLVKVEAMGLMPLEATADHKILVVRRKNGLKTYPIKLGEPEFVRAGEIDVRRDYLVVPRAAAASDSVGFELDDFTGTNRWGGKSNRRTLWNDIFPINVNTAWMMGLYVANGSSSGESRAKWTLNAVKRKDIARLRQTIKDLGFSPQAIDRSEVGAVDVEVASPILRRLFRHLFGANAHTKKIPPEILYHADPAVVTAFMAGYLAGDGCQIGTDAMPAQVCDTVSTTLALQTQLAFARQGVLAKIRQVDQPERFIRGQRLAPSSIWHLDIHHGRTSVRQMAYGTMETRNARWKVTDDYILTPVKAVTRRASTEMVYNVATPDHTYVANNALVSNCAHDLSFNFLIEEMGKATGGATAPKVELPPGALLDPKFQGMSAEEIYEHLVKGDDKTPGKTKIACKGGGSVTVDVNGVPKEFLDCRDDQSSTDLGKKAAKGDQSAQRQLQGEMKLALAGAAQQQAAMGQGKLPAGLQRMVDEILHPKLDYSEILSRWLGENGRREEYGFQRPNRRSESIGSYLPSLSAGGYADVTVLLDTSGSIGGDRLNQALGEIGGICEEMGAEIRVIVIDAAVHEDLTIEDAKEVAAKLKGGGGSDFRPAFERLEEEGWDGALLALTDGAISVPDSMPVNLKGVLWITAAGEHAPTQAYGEHIEMPDEAVSKY